MREQFVAPMSDGKIASDANMATRTSSREAEVFERPRCHVPRLVFSIDKFIDISDC